MCVCVCACVCVSHASQMSQFKVAYSSAEKSLSAADKLAKQALGLYTQALKLSTVDVAGVSHVYGLSIYACMCVCV